MPPFKVKELNYEKKITIMLNLFCVSSTFIDSTNFISAESSSAQKRKIIMKKEIIHTVSAVLSYSYIMNIP